MEGLPILPSPFSPVHSALKFSHVLGVTLPYSPKTTRPRASPPAEMSKKHLEVNVRSGGLLSRLRRNSQESGTHLRRVTRTHRPLPGKVSISHVLSSS